MKRAVFCAAIVALGVASGFGQDAEEDPVTDMVLSKNGKIEFTFLGHATFMIKTSAVVIQVDPVSQYGDHESLPKADIVLVTHSHGDHFDPGAIEATMKKDALVIVNPESAAKAGFGTALKNGESKSAGTITIKAIPAYNTTAGRDKFHPKGRDNGYLVSIDGFVIYIAGDTEDIPEMAKLGPVDVAFLPMNQPYTMVPAQVARAARMIKPKILYPYHFGDTKTDELVKLLKDEKGIEIRVRPMN